MGDAVADSDLYETAEEAFDAGGPFWGYPAIFKYNVVNGFITESYLVFVITTDMANNNSGMTAGTYAIKGGDNGASFNENSAILQTAFGSSRCDCHSTACTCSGGGYTAASSSATGRVEIMGFYTCYVDTSGSAYCGIDMN